MPEVHLTANYITERLLVQDTTVAVTAKTESSPDTNSSSVEKTKNCINSWQNYKNNNNHQQHSSSSFFSSQNFSHSTGGSAQLVPAVSSIVASGELVTATSSIRTTSKPRQILLTAAQKDKFREELERQIWLKLINGNHWNPDRPEHGRAYRCISLRLLHKRVQLYNRFDQLDKNYNQKHCLNYTDKLKINQFRQTHQQEQQQIDIENNMRSNSVCSGYSSLSEDGYTSPSTLSDTTTFRSFSPVKQFVTSQQQQQQQSSANSGYDLGTHVYIDPIIVHSLENVIDSNIGKMSKSRQYVEVLRYLDESVIDGNHEMMLWIDPGLVEVLHIYIENLSSLHCCRSHNSHSHKDGCNDVTITTDNARINRETIYTKAKTTTRNKPKKQPADEFSHVKSSDMFSFKSVAKGNTGDDDDDLQTKVDCKNDYHNHIHSDPSILKFSIQEHQQQPTSYLNSIFKNAS